jgi:hypothetical protein
LLGDVEFEYFKLNALLGGKGLELFYRLFSVHSGINLVAKLRQSNCAI